MGDRCIITVLLPSLTWLCLLANQERQKAGWHADQKVIPSPFFTASGFMLITSHRLSHFGTHVSGLIFYGLDSIRLLVCLNPWVAEGLRIKCCSTLLVVLLRFNWKEVNGRWRNWLDNLMSHSVACLFLNSHKYTVLYGCASADKLYTCCGPCKVDLLSVYCFSLNANHSLPRFCQDTPRYWHMRTHTQDRFGLFLHWTGHLCPDFTFFLMNIYFHNGLLNLVVNS